MSEPKRVAPWEDFVLRFIAIYKLFHGVFFTLVGFGLLRLRHHNVVDFLNEHLIIPYHLPENRLIDWALYWAGKSSPHMLFLLGWAAFLYAALFFAEGIGLYLRKHWAEYLVVGITGLLIPVEIYEIVVKLALWKCVVFSGNVLIVAYLVHRLILDTRYRRTCREAAQEPGAPQAPASEKAAPAISDLGR